MNKDIYFTFHRKHSQNAKKYEHCYNKNGSIKCVVVYWLAHGIGLIVFLFQFFLEIGIFQNE